MNEKDKAELLAAIENPDVRAHYKAQLEMAEEWQGDPAGGIFNSPGDNARGNIFGHGPDDVIRLPEFTGVPALPEASIEETKVLSEELGVMAVPTPVPPSEPQEPELHWKLMVFAVIVMWIALAMGYWLLK